MPYGATCIQLNWGIEWSTFIHITKTRLFKHIVNFTVKNWKYSDKNLWYFPYFCSKHRLWYSLESPRRGSSNEYLQSMFWAEIRKIIYTPLRKQAYSNILKISPPKTESFQIKILLFFHISAQNIDCGYSLVYPCKPQFYYIFNIFE